MSHNGIRRWFVTGHRGWSATADRGREKGIAFDVDSSDTPRTERHSVSANAFGTVPPDSAIFGVP